jgi:hypothetical protein
VLLDLALPQVVARVQPPNGRLEELTDYRQQATYLGEYALALGAYGLIQHDPRFAELQGHLADLLYVALAAAPERPLRSYPAYFWPFDTLPVLLALQLDDLRTGRDRSRPLIARHLAWVRSQATHPRYQLPWSRLTEQTYRGQELPRGSDVAFRLCLLPHLEPAYARSLYDHFTHHYWLEQGTLAGFAEWPAGQQRFQDVDSGPIVMGVGVAATGLGIGVALAQEDTARRDRLLTQLAAFGQMLPLLAASQAAAGNQPLAGVRFATEYTTGFLYGDAVLFYSVTWTPWPVPPAP